MAPVIFEILFRNGVNLVVVLLIFAPTLNTGLGHCSWSFGGRLNNRGPSRGRGGSAISTAVASTVLGTTNDPGKLDENTARVDAPSSPDISDVTSAATVGFCYQNN